MTDHREIPPPSRNDSATLEPGVRAARERVRPKLTQEQVAERLNVSIHTYRPWDQGKRRPARLEQVQLLALIVEAPIDVIWPATDDPLVAEALRLERQREAASRELVQRRRSPDSSPCDAGDPGEIRVEASPAGSFDQAERAHALRAAPEFGPGLKEPGPAEDPGGLPPWPDEADEGSPTDQVRTDSGPVLTAHAKPAREDDESPIQAPKSERAPVDHSGAVTLRAARPTAGWQIKRVAIALGASLLIGGIGMVVASAIGERPADAEPSSQTVPGETIERDRAEARARDVAAMRVAAERGDYDAAIAAARSLGDMTAVEGSQRAAADVLVRRADAAAGRGDLPLARKRLRRAEQQYGITPAAGDVQAHIGRIQRDRAERAERRREATRKQARATSAAPASSGPTATVATTQSSDAASVDSGEASSAAPSPSTSKAPGAESGSSGSECNDGCGLGPFPSAGQEGSER